MNERGLFFLFCFGSLGLLCYDVSIQLNDSHEGLCWWEDGRVRTEERERQETRLVLDASNRTRPCFEHRREQRTRVIGYKVLMRFERRSCVKSLSARKEGAGVMR